MMTHRSLHFPNLDATFEELPGAVLVSQHGRSYRARKWQLTAGLEQTIRTAIDHGYTCFWVEGHPSEPYLAGRPKFTLGSHCLTFARSHDEKWIFVADKPPDSHEICFRKGLRDFFESIGQAHEWEHSGGHNLRIPLDRLAFVLDRLQPETVAALHQRQQRQTPVGRGPNTGLGNEEQLHRLIVQTWQEPLRRAGCLLESQVWTGPKAVPDLLLDAGGLGFFVIELKFSHVGLVELDQLQKYLRSPGVLHRASHRPLHGSLIGRDFSPDLVREAETPDSRVSLYAFTHSMGQRALRHVAGSAALMKVAPTLFTQPSDSALGYVKRT